MLRVGFNFSVIIFLGLFFLPAQVIASSPSLLWISTPADTVLSNTYFETYHNRLQVFGYGIHKYTSFHLSNPEQIDSKLKFKPNGTFDFGAGFNYEWIRLALALDLAQVNNNEQLYGTTRKFDLQIDLLSRRWMYGINTAYYKGYYFDNPETLLEVELSVDTAIKRPDLRTLHLGVQANYVFNNEKFSLKAAVVNNERQKKSAGSVLLGWYASGYSIKGDSAIIYRPANQYHIDSWEVRAVRSLSMGASIGYAYTVVCCKNFYASAGGMIGLSFQLIDVNSNASEFGNFQKDIAPRLNYYASIGYQDDKNLIGISFWNDSYEVHAPNAFDFTYTYGKLRFFYGRRFTIAKK